MKQRPSYQDFYPTDRRSPELYREHQHVHGARATKAWKQATALGSISLYRANHVHWMSGRVGPECAEPDRVGTPIGLAPDGDVRYVGDDGGCYLVTKERLQELSNTHAGQIQAA